MGTMRGFSILLTWAKFTFALPVVGAELVDHEGLAFGRGEEVEGLDRRRLLCRRGELVERLGSGLAGVLAHGSDGSTKKRRNKRGKRTSAVVGPGGGCEGRRGRSVAAFETQFWRFGFAATSGFG